MYNILLCGSKRPFLKQYISFQMKTVYRSVVLCDSHTGTGIYEILNKT